MEPAKCSHGRARYDILLSPTAVLPCFTPRYITLHEMANTYSAPVHWSFLSALQFRGQYNPFGSLTELQLRLQRSMSLRSQRSSLQPIAINSQNSLSHSRHLTGSNGLQASSSPSAASLSARQIGRATSTDRLSRSSSTSTVPDSICIESLDYSPTLKMLGVVLTDGRCAICRTADSGLAPAEQLEFSHWICGIGSGATCLGIAPDAQLIAVGLTNGEVALYKLYGHKGGRFSIDGSQAEGPVRVVSLVDWGYGPEATGSVADLKWSPDNRAFAVSFNCACQSCAFAYLHTIRITKQPAVSCYIIPLLYGTVYMHQSTKGICGHPWHRSAELIAAQQKSLSISSSHRVLALTLVQCLKPQTSCLAAPCPTSAPHTNKGKNLQLFCVDGLMLVQVGWRRSGLAIWSASGCRLMCSLRQTARPNTFTPLSSASSSAFATDSHKQNALPMEVSDSLLCLDHSERLNSIPRMSIFAK